MNRRLGALIAVVALASGFAAGWCHVVVPAGAGDLHLRPHEHEQSGKLLGVVFWVGLALVGSSLAVRMPGGMVVDVAFAPVIAAISLGGPWQRRG